MKDVESENLGPLDPFKAHSPSYLNKEKISYIESKVTDKVGVNSDFKSKEFWPKFGEQKES